MARSFEIGPGSYVVGNVTVQVGYDASDHSICKMIVTASGSQAATTMSIPRNGNPIQAVNLGAAAAVDQQALGQQAAQGGPVGASVIPRGGFGPSSVPF
jgi:hypothetical protein